MKKLFRKCVSSISAVGAKIVAGVATCGALILGAAAPSMAALPLPVTTALTSLDTLITDMEAAIWPIIGAVVLAFATIALFKKFWRKAL